MNCQQKTGGGAITAPPTNQRSVDPHPIADTLGRCSGVQGLATLGPSPQTHGSAQDVHHGLVVLVQMDRAALEPMAQSSEVPRRFLSSSSSSGSPGSIFWYSD